MIDYWSIWSSLDKLDDNQQELVEQIIRFEILTNPQRYYVRCDTLNPKLFDYKLHIIRPEHLKHALRIKVKKGSREICVVWRDKDQFQKKGDFHKLPAKLQRFLKCVIMNCYDKLYSTKDPYKQLTLYMDRYVQQGCNNIC